MARATRQPKARLRSVVNWISHFVLNCVMMGAGTGGIFAFCLLWPVTSKETSRIERLCIMGIHTPRPCKAIIALSGAIFNTIPAIHWVARGSIV